MARLIPNTRALRIFEAAARLGSFARAAEEQCLTESAVSKQISRLEDSLDLDLFCRISGKALLTSAGQKYAQGIREALDRIDMETRTLVDYHKGRKSLNVAALPTFSNKYLLPRLGDFSRKNSDLNVNITFRIDPFDIRDTDFDAAIHFKDPAWRDLPRYDLFSEELIPVLNPRCFGPTEWLTDPVSVPLLSKPRPDDTWKRWFAAAGMEHPDPFSGSHYDSFGTLIEAVRAGIGISLIPRLYVGRELKSGELVQPCRLALKNEKTYSVILPDLNPQPNSLTCFVDWLIQGAETFKNERRAEDDELHAISNAS